MNTTYTLPYTNLRLHRIAVSIFYFLQGLTFASWASRIPDIKNFLHLNDAQFGGVLLGLPAGQITGIGLSGYLITRFGSKPVLIIATVLYPVMLVMAGLSSSVFMLVAMLFLFGIAGNMCNISVNTQAVGVEELYGRSIMASFHGLWSLAGFTGGLLSTLMIVYKINPFQHFCIIFAVIITLNLLTFKHLLPFDKKTDVKPKFFVKPDGVILILGLIAFASMISEGTMFDWSGIYFEKIIHTTGAVTRLGFIAFMSTMAGGRFIADYFITKFGYKRMLQMSGIVILAGLLLIVCLPYIVPSTIGFLMVGLGTSSVVPSAYSLSGRSDKMPAGLAIATVSSIGFLGFLIGPPTIGFISQTFNLRVAFLLIAVLALGTTFLAGKINTKK